MDRIRKFSKVYQERGRNPSEEFVFTTSYESTYELLWETPTDVKRKVYQERKDYKTGYLRTEKPEGPES